MVEEEEEETKWFSYGVRASGDYSPPTLEKAGFPICTSFSLLATFGHLVTTKAS